MDLSDRPQTYRLSGAEFDSLGGGHGSVSALATIRSAQLSKRMLLLAAVRRRPGLDSAWTVLRDVTAARPDIRRDVLGHPFVDDWATRYLRRSGASSTYFSGLAVAVTARGGSDLDMTVAETNGEVFVPTVGLAYGLGGGPVTIRLRGGDLTFTGTASTITVPAPYATDAPGWHAARTLTVGSAARPLTVMLEDLDPQRSCVGHSVAPRLDATRLAEFASLLDGAWRLLVTDYPEHAVAIATCVRSVVPLARPSTGSTSASAATAFGAVAVSTPDDAAGLAQLLIHEAQHVKLGALIDFVDLFAPTGNGYYHAPWRADPRPARALLQGIYAHVGVADFWRIRRTRVSGEEASRAGFEFAYWLAQSRLAARALATSGALTAHGDRFLGQLMTTMDGWSAVPVDSALAGGVDDLVTAVAARWRLDNHRPDPEAVAELATAWRDGRPCPAVAPPSVGRAEAGGPARVEGLAAHIRARLTATAEPPAGPAEAAYLEGRMPDAVSAFREEAAAGPDDPLAWVGLAVTVGHGGHPDAARALAERPELVRAVFTRVREDGGDAVPDDLARWLAGGLR